MYLIYEVKITERKIRSSTLMIPKTIKCQRVLIMYNDFFVYYTDRFSKLCMHWVKSFKYWFSSRCFYAVVRNLLTSCTKHLLKVYTLNAQNFLFWSLLWQLLRTSTYLFFSFELSMSICRQKKIRLRSINYHIWPLGHRIIDLWNWTWRRMCLKPYVVLRSKVSERESALLERESVH